MRAWRRLGCVLAGYCALVLLQITGWLVPLWETVGLGAAYLALVPLAAWVFAIDTRKPGRQSDPGQINHRDNLPDLNDGVG